MPMGFSCSRRASAADCSEVEPYTDAWAAAVGRASVVASGSKAVPNMAGPGADVHSARADVRSLGADVAALLLCWLLDG